MIPARAAAIWSGCARHATLWPHCPPNAARFCIQDLQRPGRDLPPPGSSVRRQGRMSPTAPDGRARRIGPGCNRKPVAAPCPTGIRGRAAIRTLIRHGSPRTSSPGRTGGGPSPPDMPRRRRPIRQRPDSPAPDACAALPSGRRRRIPPATGGVALPSAIDSPQKEKGPADAGPDPLDLENQIRRCAERGRCRPDR